MKAWEAPAKLVLIRVELQALRSGIAPETIKKISDGVSKDILKRYGVIQKKTGSGIHEGGEKHGTDK